MCGFFGYVRKKHLDPALLSKAYEVQRHRGPDDMGDLRAEVGDWSIYLAHQRLSIIDLGSGGRQPMEDQESGDALVYNGELYNYVELKEVLGGDHWETATDTEVFLKGLRHWGPKEALSRYNGMWAFCFLNRDARSLFLGRDRMGEKPLYIYKNDKEAYFASELKCLLTLLDRKLNLNLKVVGEFLSQTILDRSEGTFFKEIEQIVPSDLLKISLASGSLSFQTDKYWSCPLEVREEDPRVAANEVRRLFDDSVRIRLRSDVPVGVLLSGGLDSSAIAGSIGMKFVGGDEYPVTLLSAVSNNPKFDESVHIDLMASHLGVGVEKVPLEFEAARAFDLVEEAIGSNDGPISNYSMVAYSRLMERAASLGLKVILSGQGADELLCGYRKYLGFYWQFLWRQRRLLSLAGSMMGFVANRTMISQFTFAEANRYLPGFQKRNRRVVGAALESFESVSMGLLSGQRVQERQLTDLTQFSVPGLTHYEDRLSMAQSLEVRLPFLDHRLIEYLVPLSMDHKLTRGWSKFVFRKAMEESMPQGITWRRDKQGFVNPQSQWLKREWRQRVLETLSDDAMVFQNGILDQRSLLNLYEEYCSESRSASRIWFREIFCPVALEIWLRQNQEWIQ